MFKIKNIVLVLHAVLLIMTLSIVILPEIWMIKIVASSEGVKGMVFPLIWTVYAVSVFLTSGLTFSWLIKKSRA